MFGWVFSIFLLVPDKNCWYKTFENTQQLRCYLLGKGTVDGRSDYDAGVVSNIAYLRSKNSLPRRKIIIKNLAQELMN